MIGGGQLARMTHQAAIALGQTLRVLAASTGRSCRTGHARRGDRCAHRPRRAAPRGRGRRRAHLRPRARADRAARQAGRRGRQRGPAAGGAGARPGQAGDAPAAGGDRRAGSAVRRGDRASTTSTRSPAGSAARSWSRPCAAATTAAACCWPAISPRPATSRRGYLAEGVPVLVEERVAMRRELAALVARSPFGQGAAWPVVETVQRDGICVEVIAPAPDLTDETGQRGRAAGAAAGRRAGRGRGAGRRAVRDRRRRAAGQRAGDATAQLRALDHGRRPHQPVRAAPARGAGLPARRHRRRSRR